jgi:hypothetical protein
MYSVDQERTLAALPRLWRSLGLRGRATLSIGRTNFTAWGNDTIIGALLDAPPAAWTLTYDPGLVNRDEVQREVIGDLCGSRDPLVQSETTYPELGNYGTQWGSTRLDEFVAVNYRVAAIAGYDRILVADGCRLPDRVSLADLAHMRDDRLAAGSLPEAGALALARLRRSRDPDDAAVAVLGGFGHYVPRNTLPPGDAGEALARFAAGARDPAIAARAVLATRESPAGIAIAAQTAWASGHQAGETDDHAVIRTMVAFARAHPDLGSAIDTLRTVMPGGDALFDALRRSGGRTLALLRWRFDKAVLDASRLGTAVRLGRDLVRAYDAHRDPVEAAMVELALAHAIEPTDIGCATAYLARADARPGIWLPPYGRPGSCPRSLDSG